MRLQDHVEVELKLTVVSDDPDTVLDRVEELEQIGPLSFGPPVHHLLHDLYWDLPDFSLRARHLSIRLRQIDDRLVFTAKGGTSSADGLFRRYELEVPATIDSWHELRGVFRDEGVRLHDGAAGGEPADWLSAAGLVVTQDRATRRTARFGSIQGQSTAEGHSTAAVEMALDRTQFRFGDLTREYREIEIEQIDPGVSLSELGDELMGLFPGQLQLSTMGKYSRGLLIERQLRAAGRLAAR
jgi:inorganic triphosphatase YgiF